MYGRIGGSSDSAYTHDASWQTDAGTESFADTFAQMRLDESTSGGSSSSAGAPAYILNDRPPVMEMDITSFRREARRFHGDDIMHIAENPREYSEFVSSRARRTAEVAKQYAVRRDSDEARYFSYQLGNQSAGLMRTEGGFSMTEFESDDWRHQFPGRAEITSIVDFQVAHPLVENAGDILLEHQLRIDGERPLLNGIRTIQKHKPVQRRWVSSNWLMEAWYSILRSIRTSGRRTVPVNGSVRTNLDSISPKLRRTGAVIPRAHQVPPDTRTRMISCD
ncbi:hypothetical protein ABIB66_008514 [Bradyrhizobium sp. F1.13.3]